MPLGEIGREAGVTEAGATEAGATRSAATGSGAVEAVVGRLTGRLGLSRLVGESPAFRAVLELLPRFAKSDATVLLTGETGTGKEVVARALHYLSPRSGRPFVPVNCGALPVELVENELFGHERSAYTGAVGFQRGVIAEAEGGTLLLDEIDTLPATAQVKLLRFLQEKEYRPLGSPTPRRADLRLIAATNADVAGAVSSGRLRRDLYYRLSVLPLPLPPLRERDGDVLLLARHFLARHAAAAGEPPPHLAPRAAEALLAHPWPGNVRELEHVLERAVVLAGGAPLIEEVQIEAAAAARRPLPAGFKAAKAAAVARFERSYLEGLLAAHDGNISGAARAAGKNRRAFWELLRKHRIAAERFRNGGGTASLPED